MEETIKIYKDINGNVMALLIRAEHSEQGINFLTKNGDYQQVAYMGHMKGYKILPHYHNKISRKVDYTCETLIIRKGIIEVNLYDHLKISYTFIMRVGDIITLFSGGHGFNVIEDVEMVEIKQGPFLGPQDKTRFLST
ncbi:hypothetical protein SDC9_153444 [bioreactor metagenome]|uniref:Uncharacterized protein n=1 Tax=bioreactor metagenome TaxID=1076179 RepID=A0A645EVW6_9ZZZZ